ncbi:MAG: MerR family transcriptional regulator [Oscillospiraceae bacterium]|nr:MerR family transcriptional regulator [Oscillospiraceae bacterium]
MKPEDHLSIGAFSRIVGITPTSLRVYDNKGIFSPAVRGTGLENDYRYYAPMQITTIKMIRVLTRLGIPLKTIRALAVARTPEKLIKLLRKRKEELAEEIRFLQEAHSVVAMFLDFITEGLFAEESEIFVREGAERRIVLGESNEYREGEGFYGAFTRFCIAPHTPELNLSYPIGGYFDSMEMFLDAPSWPARFFSYDPQGNEIMAEGLYLTGYTRGYYGRTNDLPRRMAAYADRNGLTFAGPVYNTYLLDELSIIDPEQYLLQVSASVSKARRDPMNHIRRRLHRLPS